MAQNDFLQFDETQENTLTQEAYSTDVQRVGGVSSGLARSALFNKVMRQASTFVAGFGNFLAEKNINILEDLESVKTALTNLFTAKNVGVSTEVQELLGADNVDKAIFSILTGRKDSINVSATILFNGVEEPLKDTIIRVTSTTSGEELITTSMDGSALVPVTEGDEISVEIRAFPNIFVSKVITDNVKDGDTFKIETGRSYNTGEIVGITDTPAYSFDSIPYNMYSRVLDISAIGHGGAGSRGYNYWPKGGSGGAGGCIDTILNADFSQYKRKSVTVTLGSSTVLSIGEETVLNAPSGEGGSYIYKSGQFSSGVPGGTGKNGGASGGSAGGDYNGGNGGDGPYLFDDSTTFRVCGGGGGGSVSATAGKGGAGGGGDAYSPGVNGLGGGGGASGTTASDNPGGTGAVYLRFH